VFLAKNKLKELHIVALTYKYYYTSILLNLKSPCGKNKVFIVVYMSMWCF